MLRIYAPEMYLELARAFARARVEVKETPELQSPHDLSAAVQLHLQFIMNCVVAIFGVAYIEAHVNRWLGLLLDDRIDTSALESLDVETRDRFLSGLQDLKHKFQPEAARRKLFKWTALKDKIKLLYRTIGATPLHEDMDTNRRRLWQDFCELEEHRNNLIHLKTEFVESTELIKLLSLESEARRQMAQVPATIMGLMVLDLPVGDVNVSENVLISNVMLEYADNPVLEVFMLGMEYTEDEKRKWLSRRPHSFWDKQA